MRTALDVIRMDPATVRRRWSVILERTVRELQGQSCIALDDEPPPKQEIACTRSFGQPVADLASLVEAVTEFSGRATEKLRKQGGKAGQILTFILAKAVVMLLDLQAGEVEQRELDLDPVDHYRSELMAVMDRINMRYGWGTLHLASAGTAGLARRWEMKQANRTQDYMTDWRSLPIARA